MHTLNHFARRAATVAVAVGTIAAATSISSVAHAWSFDDVDVTVLGDWENRGIAPTTDVLDIAVDADGNTYTVGQLSSEIDLDPTTGEDLRTANAGSYIAKYDTSGDLVWFHAIDRFIYAAIDVTSTGTVWVGGTISSSYASFTFDFDPSDDTAELTTGFYGAAIVTSFDNDGGFLTATMLEGALLDDLTVDSNGDPIVAARYQSSLFSYAVKRFADGGVVDPADPNILAQSDMALLWFDGSNGAVADYRVLEATVNGSGATATNLDVTSDDDVVVGGYWQGSVDFDPSAGTAEKVARSLSQQDPFVASYDPSGALIWVNAFNSLDAGNGVGPQNWILDVAVGSDGRMLAIGKVMGAVNIDGDVLEPEYLVANTPVGLFLVLIGTDGSVVSSRLVTAGGAEGRIAASGDAYYIDFEPMGFQALSDSYLSGGHSVERLDLDGATQWRRSYQERGFWDGPIVGDGNDGALIGGKLGPAVSVGECGIGRYVNLFNYSYLLNVDEFGGTGAVSDAVITDTALAEISVGGPNYIQVETTCANSAVFSVSAGSLPAGMSLDPSTGTITGTPTATGPYSFTVSVTNANGTTTREFTGEVTSGTAPSWPADTDLGDLAASKAISVQVRADGGPTPTYTVTAGSLPQGLSLDEATGIISGTAIATGPYSFTITATNAKGSADHEFTGDIVNASPATWSTTPTVANLSVGTPVDQRLVAAGAPAPVYWVKSGTLPPGVYLLPNGRLAGTPTTEGSYAVTLTAENTVGGADSEVTIVVGASGTGGGTDGGGTDGGGTGGGTDGGGTGGGATGVLPSTGGSTVLTASMAAALLLAGLGLLGSRRRRNA